MGTILTDIQRGEHAPALSGIWCFNLRPLPLHGPEVFKTLLDDGGFHLQRSILLFLSSAPVDVLLCSVLQLVHVS